MSGLSQLPAGSVISLKPTAIRFCEASISATFDNGETIATLFKKVKDKELTVAEIPRISVVHHDGCIVTLNNRRLALFQKLELAGHISSVQVDIVPKDNSFWRRFSTTNKGRYAIVRQNGEIIPNRSSGPTAVVANAFFSVPQKVDPHKDDCSICLVKLSETGEKGPPVLTPCGHCFHKKCIVDWLKSANDNADTCPQCRKALTEQELKTDEDRRSSNTQMCVLPTTTLSQKGLVDVVFDNDAQQQNPRGWVDTVLNVVAPSDFVEVHMQMPDGKRSDIPYSARVVKLCATDAGTATEVQVRFPNEVTQTVPTYWVTKCLPLQVGDGIKCFRTQNGKKTKEGTSKGTVLAIKKTGKNNVKIYFDDGEEQDIPQSWVTGVTGSGLWATALAAGTVIRTNVKAKDKPEDEFAGKKRSTGLASASVLETRTGGFTVIRFENGNEQVIPSGWIQTVVATICPGDMALAHYNEKEGKGKSEGTYPAQVTSVSNTENTIVVKFYNGAAQKIKALYAPSSCSVHVGDRVECRANIDDGSFDPENDIEVYDQKNIRGVGVITSLNADTLAVHFDNGVVHTGLARSGIWRMLVHRGWTRDIEIGTIVETSVPLLPEDSFLRPKSKLAHRAVVVDKDPADGYVWVVFNCVAKRRIPRGWIIGIVSNVAQDDFVKCHYSTDPSKKLAEQGSVKSTETFQGQVIRATGADGTVEVRFANDKAQIIPATWITEAQPLEVGKRVRCHFTRNGKKTKDDDFDPNIDVFPGTITDLHQAEKQVTVFFDNCTSQKIPMNWIKDIVPAQMQNSRKRMRDADQGASDLENSILAG